MLIALALTLAALLALAAIIPIWTAPPNELRRIHRCQRWIGALAAVLLAVAVALGARR